MPEVKTIFFDFQSMPDAQNLTLQHSLTITIPALLFNLRASATRVMNPISTDSIHKLPAGGHSSAVDWHPGCPRNPFTRPRGYPGRGRKMRKCAVPSSSLCCHLHDIHISADIFCKLQTTTTAQLGPGQPLKNVYITARNMMHLTM